MTKKVFISHASEDKERFVTEFAKRLREKGVDAWLDKWEMLPGDSLVEKIFEEGLKEADAVIIVLSQFSVDKPWVLEELNVSVINKISKGTKIIPIVLDDCNVPESLKSTLWEKIDDFKYYENSFKRITSSIFGITDKPAIGSPPAHTTFNYSEIGGITKADNIVLKVSCEHAIEQNSHSINPDKIFSNENDFDLDKSEIKDCLEVLNSNGYIEVSRTSVNDFDDYNCYYKVTPYGFNKFAEAYLDEYSTIVDEIISAIVNENIDINIKLQSKLEQPIYLINQTLDFLELLGHINLGKTIGGGIHITHVSASLKRTLH